MCPTNVTGFGLICEKNYTILYFRVLKQRSKPIYSKGGVSKVAGKPPFPTSNFVDKKLSCTIPKQPNMSPNGGETLVWDCYPLVLLRKVISVE